MNKLSTICSLLAITLASSVADASTRQAQMENPIHNMEFPKLTARHEALRAMEGDWVITGQTHKGCPYGEGKFTAREHNELMKGGQFLVSRTTYSDLFKNSEQIAFFGVDPKTRQYTYAMYNNLGVVVQATGAPTRREARSLINNAIQWTQRTVNVNMHGAQPTTVYSTEMVSPNEYHFKLTAGGIIWYDGVAKRQITVNPATPQ